MNGEDAGTNLKLGQVYTYRVVLYSSRDRDFLALRLPVPAGAEIIDSSLVSSQKLPETTVSEEYHSYYGPVKRIYDDEVRFFFDYFSRGKETLSFLFRTTTPGTYLTPPAVAELMYEEEVFGRTEGKRYRIAP